jgi:hypothetical protein
MKRKFIVLACIAIAPLAFGQSQTTNQSRTERNEQNQGAATQSATDIVAVSSFTPGSSIVVASTPTSQPVTYTLSKDVRYVNQHGKQVDPNLIRSGTRVRLQTTGNDRHVGQITVIEPE